MTHDPNQPQQPGQHPAWAGQQPQQPQWGQPGFQAPQQPPQKKHTVRNVFLGVGGLVVALIVLGAALGGGGDDKKDDTAKDAPAPAASPAKKTDDKPAAKPKAKPAEKKKPAEESYGDGDYKVGTDIPAGTYESAGASDSVIPLCSITTAPTGSATMPQAKVANKADQRIIITLKASDGVVTVQGCKALHAR